MEVLLIIFILFLSVPLYAFWPRKNDAVQHYCEDDVCQWCSAPVQDSVCSGCGYSPGSQP